MSDQNVENYDDVTMYGLTNDKALLIGIPYKLSSNNGDDFVICQLYIVTL